MPKIIRKGVTYAGNIFDTQPVGEVIQTASDNNPAGYLKCDGRSVKRSDYPELFKKIGTTYGSVDNEHFNLPTENDVNTVSTNDLNGALTNCMQFNYIQLNAGETLKITSSWGFSNYLLNTVRDGLAYNCFALVSHNYQNPPSVTHLITKGSLIEITTEATGILKLKNVSTQIIRVNYFMLSKGVSITVEKV